MPLKQITNPNRKASTGAYSDGIVANGMLYVSGQGPIDLATGKVVAGPIEEEVRLTLKNLGDVLAAGGCTFADVVRCTAHLAKIDDFDAYNVVYQEFFKGVLPTRTTVESLLGLGIKVEIDCIALIPDGAKSGS